MKRWIGFRAAGVLRRFLTEENYRNAALVRFERPANLFQPDNFTRPDRYPCLFQLAAQELGDGPERRILSFGCSTGEEVFSLRRYFPTARIKGMDINRRNIAVCKRTLARRPDSAIEFETAGRVADGMDVYDAIFCMAVFRCGALGDAVRQRCDDLIRFDDFEAATRNLARSLKVGGLIFIENSNFRFCDTEVYREFEVVDYDLPRALGNASPTYGRDNRLIPGTSYGDVAFLKRAKTSN